MEKEPCALMHPDDLNKQGLTDGGLITLSNAIGEVIVKAKVFEGLQRGTVIVESLWPNEQFIGGIGINALISAEPGKPNGGAVFHDTAVKARPYQ